MRNQAILLISKAGHKVALEIQKENNFTIFSKHNLDNVTQIESFSTWIKENFYNYQTIIFIGATGIAIRYIAPYIESKYNDPAVLCINSTGKYVIPLLSGHIGGANKIALKISRDLGALPIITTQSDNEGIWSIDTLAEEFGWQVQLNNTTLNNAIFSFVNQESVALLLDIKDKGTEFLENTKPDNVDIYYSYEKIPQSKYKLIIAVTPLIYGFEIPALIFRPKVLHLGIGCREKCSSEGVFEYIKETLKKSNFSIESISDISTVDIKKDEQLIHDIAAKLNNLPIRIYGSETLKEVQVPNPSNIVEQVTGTPSVSESSAIESANQGVLLLEKQKGKLSDGNDFTFALAINKDAIRTGHIEIVGAGPGDPELVSVKGKRFLESADLILYAGSLVPIELTYYAKPGAKVVSSASLNLEEQFQIMQEYYNNKKLVVRLHTGDPCIYGAIQEQMAYFDKYNMSYHITPGISSFQAAAAALNSQFTIPEKVQTIILTRGEGRTAMPEKEKLSLLARSQSTMCIFLSASVVDNVQKELLEHYSPETPVAACYKLTWKDQKIFRGKLKDLAQIIKENNLTLTTMIVVGDAIDNREGLSRLYHHDFKHLFRE